MSSQIGKSESTEVTPKTDKSINPNEVRGSQEISAESGDTEYVEIEECTSQYLLSKNTSSFRCLTQVLLSNSSLIRNRLNLFPPLKDPGIEEAFNYSDPVPVYDVIGVEKYLNICKELHIGPLTRIKKFLDQETMNLSYYGLTSKQFRAITDALKSNEYVEHLILEDNFLDTEMTGMLCNMLEENSSLRILNLRECRIGEKGAEQLNDALSSSQFLIELDLSFNDLGDAGLKHLQQGLCETSSLTKLNISHNSLTEDSAGVLEKILLENKTLTDIDLSWNGFYTAMGNKKLFNGFNHNDHITVLNLAWNGISIVPAIAPIAKYVKISTALEHLDLSSNRLNGRPLRMMRAAILKSHSLREVRIGNNPCPPDDALYVATLMTSKPKDHPLRHLDMENILFKKEILPLLTKIRKSGGTITIGGILSNYVIEGPDVFKLLFQRCRYLLTKPKRKKARRDFGHFVLSLPENPITRPEFDVLLKKKKITKLDKDLVNELTDRFSLKKKIDCTAMVKAYMKLYPDTCLPPVKPRKKRKGKKKRVRIEDVEKEMEVHDLEQTTSSRIIRSITDVSNNKNATELKLSDDPVEMQSSKKILSD